VVSFCGVIIIMPWGQVVVGPPGCGKTTYCAGMANLLSLLGRKTIVVNLDPANDTLPYTAAVNIAKLIQLEEVMSSMSLGPNGGLVFCMEYLERNMDWLQSEIDAAVAALRTDSEGEDSEKRRGGGDDQVYFLFDFPGQVELYTHHNSVAKLLETLTTKWNFRLTAVHLVDSHYCTEPSKFISVLCTSLSTMLQLALPHINVLSKVDLVEKFGLLSFNIDYFCEVLDLSFLLERINDDPFNRKFKKLNEAMCSIIEDYSLVSFFPLNINDKESALNILRQADKASGYVFGDLEERNLQKLMSSAIGADFEYKKLGLVREKYTKTDHRQNDITDTQSDAVIRNIMETQ